MSWRLLLSVGVIAGASVVPTRAATIVPVTFEQLVADANIIVRAEVIGVRSEWRDSTANSPIVTRVTIRIEQVLKGQAASTLELTFLGGTIGDTSLTVSDMPQFTVGERDVLFVDQSGRSMSPLVGVFAGRWAIHVDAFTGREFITRPNGQALTSLADVDPRPAQSLSSMKRSATAMSVTEIEGRIREQVRR